MKSIIIVLTLLFITEIAPGKVPTFKKGVFFTVEEDVNALLPKCLKGDEFSIYQCSRDKANLTQSQIDYITDHHIYNGGCCWVWTLLDCIDENLVNNTRCSDDEKNSIRAAEKSYINDAETANCQDYKYKANTYSNCPKNGTSPVSYNIITMLILLAVVKLFK